MVLGELPRCWYTEAADFSEQPKMSKSQSTLGGFEPSGNDGCIDAGSEASEPNLLGDAIAEAAPFANSAHPDA